MEENAQKRRQGRGKQVMKKIDIHAFLVKQGYAIGYTTVAGIINDLQSSGKEAFIRQVYHPGDGCEFDWGEAHLTIGGVSEKVYIAVFTSVYSNYRYAFLFRRHDTQAFQQAHALFFSQIGGSFGKMIYDNDTVAVKRFVGTAKEPTQGLLQLSLYYLFAYRFCNARKGNEKGHVERSVEYVRRKAFCQADSFTSLEEANQHLVSTCDILNATLLSQMPDTTPQALFEEEKELLRPAPVPFESAEIGEHRVDKYSTIQVFQNRYSVPEQYVGKMITVKSYADTIICYHERKELCRHERSYAPNHWTIEIDHYLTTLRNKPGALEASAAFQQASSMLRHIYHTHYAHARKDFMELLIYLKKHGYSLSQVDAVIVDLQKSGNQTITTDKIRTVLERNPFDMESVSTMTDRITEAARAQLPLYDGLFLLKGGDA